MTKTTRAVLLAALLGALAAACGDGPTEGDRPGAKPPTATAPAAARPGAAPPNVVLVSIDTLRADRLGAWGYERGTTPELDAFAAEAVRFANAVSQAPTTTPAHMSIFTGLLPAVHLASNLHEGGPPPLDPAVPTFTELLREAGYYTAGFHGGGNVDGELGFARGFDFYSSDYISYNWMGAYRDPADLDAIRHWVRVARARGKPLFLFLHHYVCHSPYVSAPAAIRDRFLEGRAAAGLALGPDDDEKARMIAALDRHVGGQAKRLLHWGMFREAHGRFWNGVDLAKPEHRAHMTALYDAQVAYADWLFGRVRRLLAEEDAWDGSLIAVLSDHGEEFGEHGGREHRQLFAETMRVPLLIRFPDGARRGETVDRPVRTMDVMPTVFDALKIPLDAPTQAVSFLPLVRGAGSYAPPMVSYDDRDFFRVRIARDGLVYTNQRTDATEEWLFDETADPGERRNLAAERPEDLARMQRLAAEQRAADQRFLGSIQGRKREPRLDPIVVEQLRQLGYAR